MPNFSTLQILQSTLYIWSSEILYPLLHGILASFYWIPITALNISLPYCTYLYRTEHIFTALNISLPYWTSLYQTAQAQLNLSKFLIEKSPEQGLNRRWLSSSFGHSALINWATEASTCHQHCGFLFKVLTTLVEILKTSVTGGVWTAVLLIIVMSP